MSRKSSSTWRSASHGTATSRPRDLDVVILIEQRLSNYLLSHPSMHGDLNDFSSRAFKFRKLRLTFNCKWTINFQIVNQRTQ